MTSLLLVRHAAPAIVTTQSPGSWKLSDAGRRQATRLGAHLVSIGALGPVVASTETKAIETARLLGIGEIGVDERLCEVAKPWYPIGDDHAAATMRYLAGDEPSGWERRSDAVRRFDAAVTELLDHDGGRLPVAVSHGTVMSVWLGDRLPGFDPISHWPALAMPDAHLVDLDTCRLTRLAEPRPA